jgi:hypothetical protein
VNASVHLTPSTTITTIYHPSSPPSVFEKRKERRQVGTSEEDKRAQKVLANLLLIRIFAPKKNMK